jgi:hypothetical protein
MAARVAWSQAARNELPPASTPDVRAQVAAENVEVIALIRARFGAGVIGLGHQGIRFAGVPDAHTT